MKFHVPRHLALLNAGIITGTYLILFILTAAFIIPGAFNRLMAWLALFTSAAMIFTLVYIIYLYTLEKFIYSKIRLIYKNIHSVKAGRREPQRNQSSDSLIDHVREEVEKWEEEKQSEIEQMRRLEQYRREFIGNLSHEMKTPVFTIQGYVSTLLDGALEDPKVNREYLRRTEKSVERMVKILDDLDEISQLESGQVKMNLTRFDLCALTKEVTELLEMKAHKHGIRLVINHPDKPVMVEGDKEKIRQVLTNIIDNSIRYGNRDEGKTKITFFDMDENILTEITDNGIGIAADELPRVFERFYRTDRGRAATKKGKGLGLAIVKHIMEAHGQTVSVRSAPGVGTTLGLTLKKA